MSTIKVSTISPLGTDATKTITVGSAGDTIAGAGANTPSFFARNSASQSISNNTTTTIQLNETVWDTHSAFNTSTYKFVVPANQAGKYYISAHSFCPGVDDNEACIIRFQLNDTDIDNTENRYHGSGSDHQMYMNISKTFTLSVGDTVHFVMYQGSGDSQSFAADQCYMTGHRLIGV